MEIEAKFAVAAKSALDGLADADELAGFALGPVEVEEVEDTYLDTSDGILFGAGFTCRRRESASGDVLITVKSLEGAGDVFRREELEVHLDDPTLQPDEWPAGPARDRVMGLAGEGTLLPTVHMAQTRRTRLVYSGDRPVARLFLDEVRVAGRAQHLGFLEVEAELMPEGTEAELAVVAAGLADIEGVTREHRSKIVQAMELLGGPDEGGLLTEQELVVSRHLAELEDAYGRRARALLALHEGLTQAEAGARAGFSARWARHWLAQFRQDRLAIFPEEVLAEASGEGLPIERTDAAEPAGELPIGESKGAEIATEEVMVPRTPEPVETPRVARGRRSRPGVRLADTMAEAADKILAFHLERMVEHEEGTRRGEDIEELHDMRVATRRMRAALRLFDSYLDPDAMRPFLKSLRRTGRTLGAVRDLDVFREKSEHYVQGLPEGHGTDLVPLFVEWGGEYARCRKDMLAYLDSDRYVSFKDKFARFLDEPGAGALPVVFETGEVRPYRVGDVLPSILYDHAAEVWAYDEHTRGHDVPLVRFHQLRIAAKGLRYAFEFFQEVLPPQAKELISTIKRLQDHLGDLQDAVVTCNVLRDFLMWGTWGPPGPRKVTLPESVVVAPGVAAYMAARQTEVQRLVDTFPEVWTEVAGPGFRCRLAEVVGGL